MNDLDLSALQKIAIIFPFKDKKAGQNSFSSVEKILTIKALFPNLNTSSCIELFSHCDYGKYDPINITRLSDIESKGFKVENRLKEAGIILSEYSAYLNNMKKDIFFDISSTNLPRRLSRANNVKTFNINDTFINNCISSYKNNTGLTLVEHEERKINLDFDKRTIYFPKHDDSKKRFSSLIRAIATARIIPNKETLNKVINDKAEANRLRVKIILVESALFRSFSLDVNNDCFDGIYPGINTADFKKGFIWGSTNENVLENIKSLNTIIGDITTKANFEANFLEEFAKQEDEKKQKFINTKFIKDNSELNLALNVERYRVRDEINKQVSILDVVEDFTTTTIKKTGTAYIANCISPSHSDTKPSMKISPDKGNCHCFSCGYHVGIIQLVMDNKNVDFNQAVDLIAEKYNIPTNFDFIQEQFKKNKVKDSLKVSILNEFKEHIDHIEYEKVLNMNNEKALKEYKYEKRLSIEKEIEYKLKEKTIIEEPKELKSFVFSSEDIHNDKDAINYLTNIRGFKDIHPDLKLFTGKHNYPDGYTGTFKMIGFINDSNGADGKFYVGDKIGKPRSFGNKDLTILNKVVLNESNPNFIVVESQWDLIAFYNDLDCRKVMDDSVTIILNGATNVDKAINFINEHKGRYSGLYVLRQGDNTNAQSMQRLHFGTAITRVSNFNYTDEEVNNKKDINDLLRDGVKLSSRINLTLNQNLYQADNRELV